MTQFPETQDSLLLQVQDPLNAAAWEQFAKLYQPVIYRTARRKGMQDADAQDITQQILLSISNSLQRSEYHDRGIRFRHWVRRIARNAIVNAMTRSPPDAGVGGTSIIKVLNARCSHHDNFDACLEEEYRRELYRQAAARIRRDVLPRTWQAFELSVVDGLSIDETARRTDMSAGGVYAARSRIMRRLQEAVRCEEL